MWPGRRSARGSGNSPANGTFRNTNTPRSTASTTAERIGTVEPSRPGRTSTGSSAAMGSRRSARRRRRRQPKASTSRQRTTPTAERPRLIQTSRCGAQCTAMCTVPAASGCDQPTAAVAVDHLRRAEVVAVGGGMPAVVPRLPDRQPERRAVGLDVGVVGRPAARSTRTPGDRPVCRRRPRRSSRDRHPRPDENNRRSMSIPRSRPIPVRTTCSPAWSASDGTLGGLAGLDVELAPLQRVLRCPATPAAPSACRRPSAGRCDSRCRRWAAGAATAHRGCRARRSRSAS